MPTRPETTEPPPTPWIAVVGPTGSGKSELAVELAERLGGEIISTDSMQVYRHLDIGTAKATPAQQQRAPHHLIDVVEPDQPYSAGTFVQDARAVISRLAAEGKVPILCGGTGLYFRALLFGLAEIPSVPDYLRRQVEELVKREGAPGGHAELARLDPAAAARLHPNDSARIMRALEVVLATGKSIEAFRLERPFAPQAPHVLSVGYRWERAALYTHINQRVEGMMAEGWREEVAGVLAKGFSPSLKPLRSIGYRELAALLLGERGETGLSEEVAQRTRHYAKRQITWFQRHPEIFWAPPGQTEGILQRVRKFLKTEH